MLFNYYTICTNVVHNISIHYATYAIKLHNTWSQRDTNNGVIWCLICLEMLCIFFKLSYVVWCLYHIFNKWMTKFTMNGMERFWLGDQTWELQTLAIFTASPQGNLREIEDIPLIFRALALFSLRGMFVLNSKRVWPLWCAAASAFGGGSLRLLSFHPRLGECTCILLPPHIH